jgi:hypothetical protein
MCHVIQGELLSPSLTQNLAFIISRMTNLQATAMASLCSLGRQVSKRVMAPIADPAEWSCPITSNCEITHRVVFSKYHVWNSLFSYIFSLYSCDVRFRCAETLHMNRSWEITARIIYGQLKGTRTGDIIYRGILAAKLWVFILQKPSISILTHTCFIWNALWTRISGRHST